MTDQGGVLAEFLQVDSTDFVEECWAEASALIAAATGTYSIPEDVRRRATIEVGADLYHRRASRSGIVGIDEFEGTPIRINRDPMAAAWPLLRRYIPQGLA